MKRSIHIGFAGLLATGLLGCTGVVGPAAGTGTGSMTGSGSTTGTGSTPGTGSTTGTVVPGDPRVCTPGVPQTSQLPRLTRAQYDNTTRDLLGITLQPASLPSSMLAPDTTGSVVQRAWDGYQTAADALAAQVIADAAARAKVIPCTPTGDGAACAQQLIEQFGRRAFRRPLTAEETTRFVTLYTNRAQLTATGTFDEAAQLIIRAFLLSPSFLTRAEIAETPEGEYFVLSNHEVASRLSYMLWGTMPDEALFAAAAAGKLTTSAGILAEAQRMLKDPKARTKVSEFHQQYAHMGDGTRWSQITRDPALYPGFTAAMTPLLSDETNRFFDYIVFDKGGTFRDLLTSPVGFVNAALAPLYGLNAAQYGADLVQVNLDPATRSGVFTRLGFLTSYSLYDRPSAILRGAFIQKEVLCTAIGAPPPGAEATPQPTAGLVTNRERTDAQTAGAACAGCHQTLINPTGYALESYDAIGAYRQTEGGAPINTSANVVIGATTVPVTGAVDLMAKIASSPEAAGCYAQKWVQYAYERGLTSQDSCTAQTLATNLSRDGYTVVSLITDLTQSQSFRYRAKELAP
jgi:hypothetical protein